MHSSQMLHQWSAEYDVRHLPTLEKLLFIIGAEGYKKDSRHFLGRLKTG